MSPQGHRIHVLVNPPPTEYGGIVLPEQWRSFEKGGSGWIFAAGPHAGRDIVPYPGAPLVESPSDLLYQQIIMGEWVGKPIRCDLLDRSTKSPFLCCTTRDIWAIDYNPSENLEQE